MIFSRATPLDSRLKMKYVFLNSTSAINLSLCSTDGTVQSQVDDKVTTLDNSTVISLW